MTKIALAMNVARQDKALELLDRIRNRVDCYKLQMDLFGRAGPGLVREFIERDASVFLDLKFHDIPSVVANAVGAAAELRVSLLTVHASGGARMMQAAAEVSRKAGKDRPLILAVTILTSLDEVELRRVFGCGDTVQERVLTLAQMAKESGCDGVVCSPQELAAIKAVCGKGFLAVCPGIRPSGPGPDLHPEIARMAHIGVRRQSADDQARVGTPAQAARDGADYIVVGRPVYEANDPLAVIAEMRRQMEEQ